MSFDATKVDLILQYALLLAGQEDDYFDRQLGPIHLIKYGVRMVGLSVQPSRVGQTALSFAHAEPLALIHEQIKGGPS